MGDFVPKRRDVFDRLRRRIEVYRRHQNTTLGRFQHAYDNPTNGIYHQQHQESLNLRRKWEEKNQQRANSTAKNKNKDTSSNNTVSGNHGASETRRNLSIVTQKLKEKIDNNQQVENQAPIDSETSSASGPKKLKKSADSSSGVKVNVNITHQINTGGNSSQQQTYQAEFNININSNTESTNTPEAGDILCKSEPGDTQDNTQCSVSNPQESNQGPSDPDNLILDQDELEDIIRTIEKDEGGDLSEELRENLFQELDRFDQIYKDISKQEGNDSKMFAGMTSDSPGLQKSGSVGPYDSANIFDSNQNITPPVRTPPSTGYRSATQATHHATQAGPAAETLKQMAAQHQQQHDAFGMDPYAGNHLSSDSHYRQNGFQQGYDQQQQQQHHYGSQNTAYLGQQNVNSMRTGQMPYGQKSPEMGLTYVGTKPLSHYPNSQSSTPSSLQRLENQVQQAFNQNPAMEITQTQHMQVTDGSHRMQMSQTQQLQMRQPPHQQISLTQQQSFSMSGGMGPGPNQSSQQYMTDEIKMQMMQEKMRREQQQRTMMERQQQAHAQAQAAQMQAQYMSRPPPPEYKTQHSVPEGYTGSTVGSNPLQTMQNMVNQTNSLQTQGYGQIKSENTNVQMQNGMMQSTQMAAMQRMTAGSGNASETTVTGMAQGTAVQSTVGNYPGQPIQRQQSYPGAQLSAPLTRPQRPTGPTYTSAIMRNQRPPNVNVGPDGLNISQPRNQQHDWPRQMMSQSQGTRMGVPGQVAGQPVMNGTQMSAMQYNSYSNQAAPGAGMQMRAQRPMQMNAMQSQAAMMQGSTQAQQQMMMQQNMQMSQRMGVRAPMQGQTTQYGMSAPVDAGSGYSQGGAPPQDDFMNLIDSAQSGASPEFMTVQNTGGSDANWLEDILGGK